MRQRRRNPGSGDTLLWVGAAAVAAYVAYINNWLSGIGLPYTASTTTTASTPATTTATTSSTPTTTSPAVALTSNMTVPGWHGHGGGYAQIESQLQQLLAAQGASTPAASTGVSGLFGMGNLFTGR